MCPSGPGLRVFQQPGAETAGSRVPVLTVPGEPSATVCLRQTIAGTLSYLPTQIGVISASFPIVNSVPTTADLGNHSWALWVGGCLKGSRVRHGVPRCRLGRWLVHHQPAGRVVPSLLPPYAEHLVDAGGAGGARCETGAGARP
jgi:hypothetical protein